MEKVILAMKNGERQTFNVNGKIFNVHKDTKYPFDDPTNNEFCIFIYETEKQTIPKTNFQKTAIDCFQFINNY